MSSNAPPGLAESPPARHRVVVGRRVRDLVRAINDGDEAMVERAILDLSRRRRWLSPLAFAVGAFVMLFHAVRLLLSNWRLTLVALLPALWIWLAMYDLKVHFLHGRTFHVLRGPILIPIILAIAAITAASFFLNAVFGFAVSRPGTPQVRPAVQEARAHRTAILASGAGVGLALGAATMILPRWGRWWFAISLSIVLAVMSLAYLVIPARLAGLKQVRSRRDKVSAGIVGGTISVLVCTPPHVIARLGVLMMGAKWLFIPGVVLLTIGVTLQAGAAGAVKAVKMSAKLVGGKGPGGPPGYDRPDVSSGTA